MRRTQEIRKFHFKCNFIFWGGGGGGQGAWTLYRPSSVLTSLRGGSKRPRPLLWKDRPFWRKPCLVLWIDLGTNSLSPFKHEVILQSIYKLSAHLTETVFHPPHHHNHPVNAVRATHHYSVQYTPGQNLRSYFRSSERSVIGRRGIWYLPTFRKSLVPPSCWTSLKSEIMCGRVCV
jgi:hypothetical protein